MAYDVPPPENLPQPGFYYHFKHDPDGPVPAGRHDHGLADPDVSDHPGPRDRRVLQLREGETGAAAAPQAAGAIHSDLEKHFIRAETIHWDKLLESGSEANARAKGMLRLEGKDYLVQDGDVMHIRHSGKSVRMTHYPGPASSDPALRESCAFRQTFIATAMKK